MTWIIMILLVTLQTPKHYIKKAYLGEIEQKHKNPKYWAKEHIGLIWKWFNFKPEYYH